MPDENPSNLIRWIGYLLFSIWSHQQSLSNGNRLGASTYNQEGLTLPTFQNI